MNFIAIIGIVEKLTKLENGEQSTLRVKVEKPFVENEDEDRYDLVDIQLDKIVFKHELKSITKGCIVGIKGRIKYIQSNMQLIGERVQVF
ncbi:hypothetical protein FACS1894166_00300 [Bacilli bacterium]|nr:hypothetical protein FACS1894166_00300 [Bacilli bacterium]